MKRPRLLATVLLLLIGGPAGAAGEPHGVPPHGAPAQASPRRTFAALLREAQEGMEKLLTQYKGRADLEAVQRQLAEVELWTRGGQTPNPWQVKRLSFGLIAAREIEPLDLHLARQLEALAMYLAHWPQESAR